MKITIAPTPDCFTTDSGIPMRVWKGETDGGIGVTVFVSALCTDPANQDELDAALEELPGPDRPTAANYDPDLAERWLRARITEPG